MRLYKLLGACTALWLTFASAGAGAQTKWDMPTPYSDGYFHTVNIRQFAADVKAATNGQLEIVVHSNGSLIKHPEIRRAVQTGQVPIGEVIVSILANENPLYGFESVPYLAPSYDQAEKLWKSARSEVEKSLDAAGLKLLYSVPWPPQGLYTRKPISKAADLRGLKMRTYSPVTSEFARLLGSTPVTIQTPDIPQAFLTGMVDAMVTSSSGGVDSQAWDYVKYFYDIRAFLPQNIIFVNKAAFAKLDPKIQAAVLQAAEKAEKRGWEMSRAEHDKAVKTLAERGVKVENPSPDFVKELNEIGRTMTAAWEKKTGAMGASIIREYRKSAP